MDYGFGVRLWTGVLKLFFFLFSLLFSLAAYSAGFFSVQVGSFMIMENAERLKSSLSANGVECMAIPYGEFMRIRCGEFLSEAGARELRETVEGLGYGEAFVIRSQGEVFFGDEGEFEPEWGVEIVSEKKFEMNHVELVEEQASEAGALRGQDYSYSALFDREGISGDVLERRGGYFHPFLSVTEIYSDNLFNTRDDRVSDYETVVSPGIWISVPRTKEEVEWSEMSVLTPGGRSYNRARWSDRLFHLHLLYRADIERFKDSRSEDFDHHKAGGQLQLKSRGGFALNLSEQYAISHDDRGTGIPGGLDEFRINAGDVILSYDFGRLMLRGDYTNFIVDYREATSNFKDREDNVFSSYAFYRARPKTSLFVQYEHTDVAYDENVLSDSVEQNYFGGIEWDVTAKSSGMVKAGYGVRQFDDSSREDSRDFVFAGSLSHNFTPKTVVSVAFSRNREETDIAGTEFALSNRVRMEYSQRITHKISGTLAGSYTDRTYEPDLTFGGVTGKRKDEVYQGLAAFKYEMTRWLSTDIGYAYTQRKSTFTIFDYETNRAFFRITAAL